MMLILSINLDSYEAARSLLKKACEVDNLKTDTDKEPKKRVSKPVKRFSPTPSDSDDDDDSASNSDDKLKRKNSTQSAEVLQKKLLALEKKKKMENPTLSPIRDFDDNSSSGELDILSPSKRRRMQTPKDNFEEPREYNASSKDLPDPNLKPPSDVKMSKTSYSSNRTNHNKDLSDRHLKPLPHVKMSTKTTDLSNRTTQRKISPDRRLQSSSNANVLKTSHESSHRTTQSYHSKDLCNQPLKTLPHVKMSNKTNDLSNRNTQRKISPDQPLKSSSNANVLKTTHEYSHRSLLKSDTQATYSKFGCSSSHQADSKSPETVVHRTSDKDLVKSMPRKCNDFPENSRSLDRFQEKQQVARTPKVEGIIIVTRI